MKNGAIQRNSASVSIFDLKTQHKFGKVYPAIVEIYNIYSRSKRLLFPSHEKKNAEKRYGKRGKTLW
jgi:hypothetical protein